MRFISKIKACLISLGVVLQQITNESDTQVRVQLGNMTYLGENATYSVVVTSITGATVFGNVTFTFDEVLFVSSITPSSGSLGTRVLIQGGNLVSRISPGKLISDLSVPTFASIMQHCAAFHALRTRVINRSCFALGW